MCRQRCADSVHAGKDTQMSNFLVILAPIWLAMAALGAWVSLQKHRNPSEGLILGILFGPFGVLIAALMPIGSKQNEEHTGAAVQDKVWSLDDRGQIAYLANRYRDILDEILPEWRTASYHRRKAILR